MNDAELRELYAQILARSGDVDREDCVTPEQLEDLVERRGPETARLEQLDHVMSCAACREEFELLRALAQGQPQGKRRGNLRPLAVAAALAMLVSATAIWQLRDAWQSPDVTRGPQDVLLVAPAGQQQPDQPLRFVWRPVEGAWEYQVVLTGSQGAVVLDTATPDTALAFATPLEPGVYIWWVRARLDDGSERSSPTQTFTITDR